ncbi:MAG: virulence protein RhuM/Fic/DOC family protein [Candidatus Saccharibacteria bacterium]|nr:virulence protein RhuM/Fic/DOC family protein [Candidatus Saccharibacteria bacterium]
MANQIEVYKIEEGEIVFNIDEKEETIWATQAQIAQLFGVKPQNITYHLKNIYNDKELIQNRTCKDSLQVQDEGGVPVKRKVKMYNLDAIISVGYRVNSKKATDFRIWATSVLHNYLTKGVAVNERRLKALDSKKLKEVEGMMGVIRRLITRQALDAGEANGVLEVISRYSTSFETLKEYDDGFIDLSSINAKSPKKEKKLTPDFCLEVIAGLKKSVKGSDLFGKPRNDAFKGSIESIYQSYNGEDLYKTVAEKAAHLLYFVIKDHPFYDGNKRIGSLLFIVFLTINDQNLTKNGETKISDRALTALALLIAESNPEEKQLITSLIRKLLED